MVLIRLGRGIYYAHQVQLCLERLRLALNGHFICLVLHDWPYSLKCIHTLACHVYSHVYPPSIPGAVNIERGRKSNIPRHLRFCRACKSSSIGDEFHVLMECTNLYLQNMRNECLSQLLKHIPQFQMLPMKEKFVYILSGADIMTWRVVK